MANKNFQEEELLKIPQVIEEIKRHLWIESEKSKRDVGFEHAKKDWLEKYAEGWVKYFRPDLLKKAVSKNCCDSKAGSANCCTAKPVMKPATPVKKEEVKISGASKRNAKKYF